MIDNNGNYCTFFSFYRLLPDLSEAMNFVYVVACPMCHFKGQNIKRLNELQIQEKNFNDE